MKTQIAQTVYYQICKLIISLGSQCVRGKRLILNYKEFVYLFPSDFLPRKILYQVIC